jgi:hypothetical protein
MRLELVLVGLALACYGCATLLPELSKAQWEDCERLKAWEVETPPDTPQIPRTALRPPSIWTGKGPQRITPEDWARASEDARRRACVEVGQQGLGYGTGLGVGGGILMR